MNWATPYFAAFLLAALTALGGLFVYGWRRRNRKAPNVTPLPKDDDGD